MDPWVRSASLRFQTGFSLMLLVLAGFIGSIELVRHRHGAEGWIMVLLLAIVLGLSIRVVGRLRADESNSADPYKGAGRMVGVK